jgi:FKBP-type peptidyl-prolyl cis-trans isomerase FkpA
MIVELHVERGWLWCSSMTSGRFLYTLGAVAAAVAVFLTTPKLMAESALEKGEKFLAENAKKEGVQTTESGLQYKHLKEGEGKSPKATDTVLVHYKGTLIDGTEFDSSYRRNQPIEFPLNGVIPGWTEGVQLMKEGGKIQLFIPSRLAYGSRGAGGVIGPDETLIFEIELLKVR